MTHRLWLVETADVRCAHHVGRAPQRASQRWVRVGDSPVLVDPDPVGRTVGGCPNVGVSIKPCTSLLLVRGGRSTFVRIEGKPVLRSDLTGLTDGTPPGQVRYQVLDPGQPLVGEEP